MSRLATLLTTAVLLLGLTGGALAAPPSQSQTVVDEILNEVSQVRGLPVQASTPASAMPREALVERLSRAVNTDRAVREFLTSQMLLETLGAMPPGFDLRDLQLRLLAEQTLAIYDYDERAILLVADAATGGELSADTRLVIAHEVTHALQDQHFDLRRILPVDAENSDAAMAAQALVEGDAMLTMRVWGRQHLRPDEKRSLGDETTPTDPVLDAAPPLVQGELLFPYDAGWVFAQLLYQDGGFAAVNQAFQRPPRSTEHILHPEKYAAGEQPVQVTISPLERGLGGTWETLRTDVFGELVLRLLLEPHVGWPTAEAAAEGWGGDAYTILEDADGRRIVAMVTVWDTESDAAQMYNAFAERIVAQFQGDQRRTLALPAVSRWTIPGYQVQALKTENVVRIVYAPDAQTLDRVEALISEATIGPAGPITPRPATPPGAAPAATPATLPTTTPTPGDGEPGDESPLGPAPSGPSRFDPTPVPTPSAQPSDLAPPFVPPPAEPGQPPRPGVLPDVEPEDDEETEGDGPQLVLPPQPPAGDDPPPDEGEPPSEP